MDYYFHINFFFFFLFTVCRVDICDKYRSTRIFAIFFNTGGIGFELFMYGNLIFPLEKLFLERKL